MAVRKSGRELDPITRVDTDAVVPFWPSTVGTEPDAITAQSLFEQIGENDYRLSAGAYDSADHPAVLADAIARLEAIVAANSFGASTTLQLAGDFYLSETLTIPGTLDGLDIKGGSFIAVANPGYWSASVPLIDIASVRNTIEGVKFDCLNLCAGLRNSGGNSIIRGNRGIHYIGYALKEAGGSGGTWWMNNYCQQWGSGDTEFDVDANWTAKGLWMINGDCKVIANTFNWNGAGNLYVEDPAGSTLVRGNHFFNGRPGSPTVDMVNLYLGPGAGAFNFVHNYFDNGLIQLYSDNFKFSDNFGLYNTSNATLSYWARVFGSKSRSNPDRMQWKGWKWLSSNLSNGSLPQISVEPWTFFSGPLANPFTTTNGSPIVTVAHTAHTIPVGTGPVMVTFSGASAVGGLTLNGTYAVTGVDADTYTVNAGSNASANASGGGTVTTSEIATYDGDFSHYADGTEAVGLEIEKDSAIGASYDGQVYVQRFFSPNGSAIGAKIGFRDSTTTDTDGIPTIGCRSNRVVIEHQDSAGVVIENTSGGSAAGGKVQYKDTATVTSPYHRSTGDNLIVSAPAYVPETTDTTDLGGANIRFNKIYAVQSIWKPPASADALTSNGQVTFELTNNTTLTWKARGSDGTTRSGTITLA